jgi:hypothetical protein
LSKENQQKGLDFLGSFVRIEPFQRVADSTDQDKRKRAAKRRQREEKLRLERAVAIANPAMVKTPLSRRVQSW